VFPVLSHLRRKSKANGDHTFVSATAAIFDKARVPNPVRDEYTHAGHVHITALYAYTHIRITR
jgi:hypothetical protein